MTMAGFSSVNLRKEWSICVNKAMGFDFGEECEDEKRDETDGTQTEPMMTTVMLHLLAESASEKGQEEEKKEEEEGLNQHQTKSLPASKNPWMDNAGRIYEGMVQIHQLLHRKKASYLQPNNNNNSSTASSSSHSHELEASLLESTVLSYVATTANQIDSLRTSIASTDRSSPVVAFNGDYELHCQGIVSFLMQNLKEEIANPFKLLQKQRTRPAMALWDQPLQCRLNPETFDPNDQDNSNSNDLRFLPDNNDDAPSSANDASFMNKYQSPGFSQDDLKRPTSMLLKETTTSMLLKETTTSASEEQERKPLRPMATTKPEPKNEGMPYQNEGFLPQEDREQQQQRNEALAQEAVLLTALVQNDLDSIQQVEARMTEITTLLSQFSELVTEQQADIAMIHETTVRSKQNVVKGQDHLIDAAERVQRSKHYMATLIVILALVLLFFNAIAP